MVVTVNNGSNTNNTAVLLMSYISNFKIKLKLAHQKLGPETPPEALRT